MDQFVFDTDLGYMGIALRGSALLALVFGHPNERTAQRSLAKRVPQSLAKRDSWSDDVDVEELIHRLRTFALGEPTDFSDVTVDVGEATAFQRRVIAACREISWGETRTYGELAAQVGRPGAARAVGAVMAGNRAPLVVPCHRVVAASGELGGFSAPQGLAMKRRLLTAEGSLGALGQRSIAATLQVAGLGAPA